MNYTYPSAFNLKSAIANARAAGSGLDAHNAIIELCDYLSQMATRNELHARAYAAANAQDSAHDGICAALAILDSGAKEPRCRGCDVPVGETHEEFCS